MVRRHGANARDIAKVFADTHTKIGNEEMAAFWRAVTAAIEKVTATAR
jgi:hypothetical protein